MKEQTEIAIIGAGISGCAAAQQLQASGIDYVLLEKNVEAGGLTRSINVGSAHFDYTGHFLHLARYKDPADIPYAKQDLNDWQLIERKSAVYIDGRFVPAPFQYNLHGLEKSSRDRCIADYRNRPVKKDVSTFKEYLISGFGKSVCDMFLFPYNQKQSAISLENLSVYAVKRFFPAPDVQKIEAGYLDNNTDASTYNSLFWYPKRYGIGLLADGLARDLDHLYTNCIVEKINLANKTIQTSLGTIAYKKLISSAPLKWFCLNSDSEELKDLGLSLRHNNVLSLNVLLNGELPDDFNGYQWVYIPDPDIPIYRMGIYSNIHASCSPPSSTSLYMEVAYSYLDPLPGLDTILLDVFLSLEKLGWVRAGQVATVAANWIDCAYVHFDHRRNQVTENIFEILKDFEVAPIGRYGLWDYISMEDSIDSGLNAARKVAI